VHEQVSKVRDPRICAPATTTLCANHLTAM
jgi:hypothetical protein